MHTKTLQLHFENHHHQPKSTNPQQNMTLLHAFLTDLRSGYKSSTVYILSDNANVSCPSPELLEGLSIRSDRCSISLNKQPLHEPQYSSRCSSAKTSDSPISKDFIADIGSASKENKQVLGRAETANLTKDRTCQQHRDASISLDKISETRSQRGTIKPQNGGASSEILLYSKSDNKLYDYGQIQMPLGTTATPIVACSILPPTA